MNVWIAALLIYLAIGAALVIAGFIAAHSKRMKKWIDISPQFLKKNVLDKVITIVEVIILWPLLAYMWLDYVVFELKLKHYNRRYYKHYIKKGS